MTLNNKISLEPAFVLHTRPFQETSIIVELFTASFGRINAVAKGAKRPKSPLRSILTPSSKLSVTLSGKHDLKNLSSAEITDHFSLTSGLAINSLVYINELIIKATEKEDPHQGVFKFYESLLRSMSKNQDRILIEKLLREFELNLLQEMGYGVDLQREAETSKKIEKSKQYQFDPDKGFSAVNRENDNINVFKGDDILRFFEGNLEKKTTRDASKSIMRASLDYHLGNKTLNIRKYLRKK